MKCVKIFLAFFYINFFFNAVYSQGNVITHIIKPGETLTGIAALYKISVKDLERLNNINEKVIIRSGQKLIIPLGGMKNNVVPPVSTTAKNLPINQNQHKVIQGENVARIAKQYNTTEKQLMEWNNLKTDLILVGQLLYISKPTAQNTVITKPIVTETKPIVTKPKTQISAPVVVASPEVNIVKSVKNETPVLNKNTYFEKEFLATGKNIEAKSATFKTSAGWQDKKYYILSNSIEIGTIVKLIHKNKFTYAKVLGSLPNLQNEENIQARLSTSTAAILGAFDSIFDVKIEY